MSRDRIIKTIDYIRPIVRPLGSLDLSITIRRIIKERQKVGLYSFDTEAYMVFFVSSGDSTGLRPLALAAFLSALFARYSLYLFKVISLCFAS